MSTFSRQAHYGELEKLNAANSDLAELMEEFEHSFDNYVRSQKQGDLKTCIGKAAMYAEGIAGKATGRNGSLGDLCDILQCWPHRAVKSAVKSLYGFCSDYPGIRHGTNTAARLRNLDSRDAIFFPVLFLSLAGYVTESIDTKEPLGAAST